MGAFYGLRRGEILGLRDAVFDFEDHSFIINHTVTMTCINGKSIIVEKDKPKTKSSFRKFPLVPPVEYFIKCIMQFNEYYKKVCGNCYNTGHMGYLYKNELGQRIHPEKLSNDFPKYLIDIGLPRIRLHDLRHSCANLLHKADVSLKDIQEWLGHSTIATTANIYLDFDYSNKSRSVAAISNTLSPVQNVLALQPAFMQTIEPAIVVAG